MAEFLVIRLGADEDSLASWIAVDDNGARRSPPVTGQLSEAAKDVGARSVIVLVPAGDISTLTVDLPARGARLRAALPFALEEQVADEIENLHFAPGKRFPGGRLPVAVVTHDKMADWLGRLDDAGISAAQLIPENHGLAYVPNTLSVLAAEDQVMFNDGTELEFVLQGVKPSDALVAAGVLDADAQSEEDAATSRHLLVYCEPTDDKLFEHDWTALRHELESVDINLLPDGVLPRLAVTVASGAGINLLQGRYGEKIDIGGIFRPWRTAAMLFLAMGLLGLAGKAIDYYQLTTEETALRQQFADEYRKIRPGDSNEIMDPAGLVLSIRRGLGGSASAPQVFLPSLQHLAMALRDAADTEIQVIAYRAGVVDVRLTAPDVATLDQIRKSVSESAQFTATIQSTDQVGDRVNSRIQIREVGS
jgi:general secretion pathway protein L